MSDKLVTIATFGTPLEADLAKIRLDAAGILSFVQDQTTAGMQAFFVMGHESVRLQVRTEDAQEAIKVISEDTDEDFFKENEFEPEPVAEPEAEREKQPHIPESSAREKICPECGSDRVESAYNLSFSRFLLSVLMLGIPLLFFRRQNHCSRCGHSW